MKITSKTQYALRTLMDLAGQENGEVTTVADISRRRHIPSPYLEQILLLLKRGGMVKSRRGRQGGYELARKGSLANLADIIALTDDALLAQPEGGGSADGADRIVMACWRDVNDQFLSILKKVTVQDLCDSAEAPSNSNYSI